MREWGRGGLVSHRSCQTVWLLLSIKVWQSHQGFVSQRSVRHPPAEQLACRAPVTHVDAVTYSHHQNEELLNWQVTLETTLNANSDKTRGNWSLRCHLLSNKTHNWTVSVSFLHKKIKYLHLEAQKRRIFIQKDHYRSRERHFIINSLSRNLSDPVCRCQVQAVFIC